MAMVFLDVCAMLPFRLLNSLANGVVICPSVDCRQRL
jgi:hypothetical protein